jgi:nucleotide-binding universal stress UspA family protein
MKKILVPTDFSDGSLNAANYAIAVAKVLGLEVTLLHVVDFNPLNAWPTDPDIIVPALPQFDMEELTYQNK